MHSTVIVGSGPYGLSLAAQLAPFKVDYRIFGPCMETWEKHMPPNMLLKSEGFASDIYAPGAGYPLRQFCREQKHSVRRCRHSGSSPDFCRVWTRVPAPIGAPAGADRD